MGHLLGVDESLLVVVDAQPGFYGPEPAGGPPPMPDVLARVAWLAGVATALGVPTVVTEEDAVRNGPTAPAILAAVPAGTTAFAKHVFGGADQPDILAAITATGRRTAVVVGLETDVCVGHTAAGLLDRGWRVVVVEDATYAPGPMHEAGLRRVASLGAEVLHAKGVFYEWIRTLEASRAFGVAYPSLRTPPGFDL